MLFIGSTASKIRLPKDTDIISTSSEFEKFKAIYGDKIKNLKFHKVHYSFTIDGKWFEVEICDENTSGFEYQKLMNSFDIIDLDIIPCATDNILLSIKKGHVNFPVNFYKNVGDYNILLKRCKGIDVYPHLTKMRFKETEDRLGKLKTPSLKKSSMKFFSQSHDFFKSYFVHDNIHKIMAHLDKPLYEYMQPEVGSALCSKDMWNAFSDDWKDKCVLEEAYVIALERKLIPMVFGGGKIHTVEDCIKWSLMRISTTLCSGWFRQWACDNWDRINSKIDYTYFDRFLEAVDNGEIKLSETGVNYENQY